MKNVERRMIILFMYEVSFKLAGNGSAFVLLGNYRILKLACRNFLK